MAPNMETNKGLNLKATELRLGLPGSESPERNTSEEKDGKNGYSHLVTSGAKRVFSDTINGGSGKWVFSSNGGSDGELTQNGALFSPRGGAKILGGGAAEKTVVKENVIPVTEKKKNQAAGAPHAAKAQVVGWPPIRSFRKNSMAINPPKNDSDADEKLGSGCLYVKVSMDGAPYLRKVDLKTYSSYFELSSGLEKMFSCFTIGQCGSHGATARDGLSESRLVDLLHGSEYVLTYEDKDGDWMLVGDVPWNMFTETCKRMRIMKSCDATGLAPRAMEKCRNRN
ncbi:Auxin-responsive protein [Heracleum sosnowskyi]|uniref:Auxin-responsive protein n=1 Tax=Heracleum sosnowskyi TaxID=360622 RepID=A0AAD8GUZ1_9APIA|nr:Auxin-responsive protein [Heracleum sosnowskyi]